MPILEQVYPMTNTLRCQCIIANTLENITYVCIDRDTVIVIHHWVSSVGSYRISKRSNYILAE